MEGAQGTKLKLSLSQMAGSLSTSLSLALPISLHPSISISDGRISLSLSVCLSLPISLHLSISISDGRISLSLSFSLSPHLSPSLSQMAGSLFLSLSLPLSQSLDLYLRLSPHRSFSSSTTLSRYFFLLFLTRTLLYLSSSLNVLFLFTIFSSFSLLSLFRNGQRLGGLEFPCSQTRGLPAMSIHLMPDRHSLFLRVSSRQEKSNQGKLPAWLFYRPLLFKFFLCPGV